MAQSSAPGQLFPALTADQIDLLRSVGDEMQFADGQTVLEQGVSPYHFYVILEGQLRVTRRFGNTESLLAVHGPGEFTGDIGMMSDEHANANAQAVGPLRVLRIERHRVRQLLASDGPVSRLMLSAMSARSQDVEAEFRQQEKLAALGKLSAGLAHELNNPASAAQRSASLMMEALRKFGRMALTNDARFAAGQRDAIIDLLQEVARGRQQVCLLTPVQRSDRETRLADWLETHGLSDPWNLTGIFVEGAVTVERFEAFSQGWTPDALAAALQWMECGFTLVELTIDIEQSTRRISDVVRAMKEYSHMDQAAVQVVDVNRSLDTTLTIFAHRLKNDVVVKKDYDLDLPLICAYAGELNQVWTNVIDNAIDAMQGKGALRVRTLSQEGSILVEIGDSGPGIPEAIQSKIFEPFFTTKPPGQGTGLGLDICWRIITQHHHGTIRVHSQPGDTRFDIVLPTGGPRGPDEEHPGGSRGAG